MQDSTEAVLHESIEQPLGFSHPHISNPIYSVDYGYRLKSQRLFNLSALSIIALLEGYKYVTVNDASLRVS